MKRIADVAIASGAVLVGALLAAQLFEDGVHIEDVEQAFFIALVAGLVQLWLSRKRPPF